MKGETVNLTVRQYINRKLKNESDPKIADSLYVCHRTLMNWKASNKITDEMIKLHKYKAIMSLKSKGLSTKEISNELKINRMTISNITKQFKNKAV